VDQARTRVAAQAATDAMHKAKTDWYWSGVRTPVPSDDLWHGYEDGTATYYLAPGLYLRFQPDHRELGTKQSVGWTQQYTLESSESTTVLTGPAHLLELLDSLQATADPDAAANVLAGERLELLTAIVDAALSEQPGHDLTCAAVTGQVIQQRAEAAGISGVTDTEAVDLINDRLFHRRTVFSSGAGGHQEKLSDAERLETESGPDGTAVTQPTS
jgi:hypothetical protein